MHPKNNIPCPVCGGPNKQDDRCTFCGADLREAAPPPPGSPEPGPLASSAGPGPQRTEGAGQPPSSSGPPQGWESPALAPKLAGFWIRTVAYMIDGFLVELIYILVLGVAFLGYTSGSDSDALSDFSHLLFGTNFSVLNILSSLIYLAYFTFFLGRRGQTPGKMICGLRVVRLDGSPVGYGQAAVRTLGYYLNLLTLCIGFLWVAVDPKKQGFHDKIAGTVEIRVGLAEPTDWGPSAPR